VGDLDPLGAFFSSYDCQSIRPGPETRLQRKPESNDASEFIEFLKHAFRGTERLRVPTPDGKLMHVEVAIGNGIMSTWYLNTFIGR